MLEGGVFKDWNQKAVGSPPLAQVVVKVCPGVANPGQTLKSDGPVTTGKQNTVSPVKLFVFVQPLLVVTVREIL